jgi:hypothetical protein
MLSGMAIHFLFGLALGFVYSLIFESLGASNWWIGLLVGGFHGTVVLTVFLQTLPYLHPRLADKHQGPTPTRQLEPPGFLGMNYGRSTPLITFIAHAIYGLILGAFLDVAPHHCC